LQPIIDKSFVLLKVLGIKLMMCIKRTEDNNEVNYQKYFHSFQFTLLLTFSWLAPYFLIFVWILVWVTSSSSICRILVISFTALIFFHRVLCKDSMLFISKSSWNKWSCLNFYIANGWDQLSRVNSMWNGNRFWRHKKWYVLSVRAESVWDRERFQSPVSFWDVDWNLSIVEKGVFRSLSKTGEWNLSRCLNSFFWFPDLILSELCTISLGILPSL